MNKILNKFKIHSLLLLSISILILSGCKSKKLSVVDTSGYLKTKSHNEVLDDVLTKELDYKTITTKGKITFKGKRYTTVFKLVKDEFIQASVRAPLINIEAMRMNITPDKIVLIDRLGAKYAEIDMKGMGMNLMVAFNFYNLQALLTNQLFLAGDERVSKSDYEKFHLAVKDNTFILSTQDKNKLAYDFAVDPSDRIISTKVANSTKDMSVVWKYEEFVQDAEYIYPTNMIAEINIKKKKAEIGISYSNLDINTEFEIDKSVPTKYKKIEIADLLGAYAKFM